MRDDRFDKVVYASLRSAMSTCTGGVDVDEDDRLSGCEARRALW